MYLFHTTSKSSLEKIKKSGKLLPSSKTKNRDQTPDEISYSDFIFFGTAPTLEAINKILRSETTKILIFPSEILKDYSFYTSKTHSGGTSISQKKYPKNYKRRDDILKRLYKQSIKVAESINMPGVYPTFQEVYIKARNGIDLKNMIKVY